MNPSSFSHRWQTGLAIAALGVTALSLWRWNTSSRTSTRKDDTVPHSARSATNPPVETTVTSRGSVNSPLNDDARIQKIRDELDSGRDSSTGQEFKVGPGGNLTSAPTRRVALLDELIRLDLKAAAEHARKILAEFKSPDEWAAAMRACALADPSPEGHAFLNEKFRAMVEHEAWANAPSVGFLEAFDIAVHLGGTNLLPTLTDCIRQKDNRALAHAAYLSLDRLVINEPVSTLAYLLNNPETMAGREITRANYFARGDVADPAQKALVEKYLISPNLSRHELETFAGLFPNVNLMISNNLLTSNSRSIQPTVHRDSESFRTVAAWLSDPRFQSHADQLRRIQTRLSTHLRPAEPAEPIRDH